MRGWPYRARCRGVAASAWQFPFDLIPAEARKVSRVYVARISPLGLTRFSGRVVLSFLLGPFAVDDAPSVIGLSTRRSI